MQHLKEALLLFLFASALIFLVLYMKIGENERKVKIISLSKSYRDFPWSVCYSGTKSYLLEVVPIAEDYVNVVLVRYWIWAPQNYKCPETLTLEVSTSKGKISELLYLEHVGMYCYTPLVIVIISGEGVIRIADEAVSIPSCWADKHPWLNGGKLPSAILLSGRLDDLKWENKGTKSFIIETSKIYESTDLKVLALRISAFKPSGNYVKSFKVKILEEDSVIEEFEIPAYSRNLYSETNAILIALPPSANVIMIENNKIEV